MTKQTTLRLAREIMIIRSMIQLGHSDVEIACIMSQETLNKSALMLVAIQHKCPVRSIRRSYRRGKRILSKKVEHAN